MIGSYYQSLFIFQSTTKRVGELLSELIRSLIEQHTFCDRELSPELIESPIDQKLWRSGALIRAHWLPDRSPIYQKLLAIRSSCQSSLTPWSIKNLLRSKALIRANWFYSRPTTKLWSGDLIRSHWIPDWSKPSCDQELLWEDIDVLIDRHTCCDRQLLLELIWLPNKVTNFLRSKALIRAHWPLDRPTTKLWSGALIRAHRLPDWSKTSCDQELFLEHIDSLIDQQLSRERELL